MPYVWSSGEIRTSLQEVRQGSMPQRHWIFITTILHFLCSLVFMGLCVHINVEGAFEGHGACIHLILVQMLLLKWEEEYQEVEVHEKGRARTARIRVHPKIIITVVQKFIVKGEYLCWHFQEADPECKYLIWVVMPSRWGEWINESWKARKQYRILQWAGCECRQLGLSHPVDLREVRENVPQSCVTQGTRKLLKTAQPSGWGLLAILQLLSTYYLLCI